MIFRTGHIIVTGINHPTRIDGAVNRLVNRLSDIISTRIRIVSVRVKTILATAHMHRLIDPYTVCSRASQHPHMFRAYWEPEICNAIVLHNVVNKDHGGSGVVTVKLFPRTGSVTVFGRDLVQMGEFLARVSHRLIL